jgi:hypothetical protein
LPLLDGTRIAAGLADALGEPEVEVVGALVRLASVGLLALPLRGCQ